MRYHNLVGYISNEQFTTFRVYVADITPEG
nr:MAG TPA: hypothetical protein [Bacteriophage sp.]